MLHSTKGIVFHHLKYSETSIIVKIYTGLFGMQSYLVRGIRKPGAKVKPGLFQSLTLLDLEVYHKEHASLQTMKEVRLAHPWQTIPFDMRKSAVAQFLNELVYKSIREEESNPALFVFLWNSLLTLDRTEEPVAGFHLRFALELMHHLGIFPQLNHTSETPYFDLREGMFHAAAPVHPDYLGGAESERFYLLMATPGSAGEAAIRNARDRRAVLETILRYYRLHLPGFGELHSHGVLHEVLG
jgi:DNA repair protein RecO (recombination protein O)